MPICLLSVGIKHLELQYSLLIDYLFKVEQQDTFTSAFKCDPNYFMLKVFGCNYYHDLRPYNKNKLQFRSIKCTFLGYNLKYKSYKCITLDGRIYLFRDVIFDEYSFLFSKFDSTTAITILDQFFYPSLALHLLFLHHHYFLIFSF